MEKQKTKVMYLGVSRGTSRQNGSPFWVLHIGVPMPASFDGVGYIAKTIYLDTQMEYEHCMKYKCGEIYELSLINFKGQYKVVAFA